MLFLCQLFSLFLTSTHFVLWLGPHTIGIEVLVFVTILLSILNGLNIAMVIEIRIYGRSIAQVIIPSRRRRVLVWSIENSGVSKELSD